MCIRDSPYVEKITGITQEMLDSGHNFSEVYEALCDFADPSEDIFCSWAVSYTHLDVYKRQTPPSFTVASAAVIPLTD